MKRLECAAISTCLTLLVLGGCQTSPPSRPIVQAATAQDKQATIDRIKLLQGTWNIKDSAGQADGKTTFTVGDGNTVREVMFPGTTHEMTNMYHMDGSSIVCTHYCAMGNQPRMIASPTDGPTLHFKLDRVSNLRAPDEQYMGEMVLTFKGPDTIEQRWTSLKQGEVAHESVFTLTRVQ